MHGERMKPANDPRIDYKEVVRENYNKCAQAYGSSRSNVPNGEIEVLMERLPEKSRVLDIGCGNGVPNLVALSKYFKVTGVDISEEQIARAKRNVPNGNFLCCDIMKRDFGESEFDAIISYYAVFHLPKEEHMELFRRVYKWLSQSGYFIATLGCNDEEPYTEDDFFGVTMYWSNYGKDQYRAMLTEAGFHILDSFSVGHGYDETAVTKKKEEHPVFVMKK